MAWVFLYGLLYHNIPFTTKTAPAEAVSNLSAFIGHSIFGITTAVVYVKLLSKYAGNTEDAISEPHVKSSPKKHYLSPAPARKITEEKKIIRLRKPIKLQ